MVWYTSSMIAERKIEKIIDSQGECILSSPYMFRWSQNKLVHFDKHALEVQIPELYPDTRSRVKAQICQPKPLCSYVPCCFSVKCIAVELDGKKSDISTLMAPGGTYASDYLARFVRVAQQTRTLMDSYCSWLPWTSAPCLDWKFHLQPGWQQCVCWMFCRHQWQWKRWLCLMVPDPTNRTNALQW